MPGRLEGKTAIVTGAAQGIGRAIADAFAAQGARLVIADLQEDAGQAVVDELRACGADADFVKTDVSLATDTERMAATAIERFGRIDILCENAGIYPSNPIEDTPEEVWRQIVAVNLFGVFLCTRACLPQMKKQKYGRVVVTASVTGPRVGEIGDAHYAATKAGVMGFVRRVAPLGIAVNAVEPGYILTDGMKATFPQAFRDEVIDYIPLGRMGRPEEIAQVMLFLVHRLSQSRHSGNLILNTKQRVAPAHGNRGKRPGGQAAVRWRMRSGKGRMGGAPGMSSRLPR